MKIQVLRKSAAAAILCFTLAPLAFLFTNVTTPSSPPIGSGANSTVYQLNPTQVLKVVSPLTNSTGTVVATGDQAASAMAQFTTLIADALPDINVIPLQYSGGNQLVQSFQGGITWNQLSPAAQDVAASNINAVTQQAVDSVGQSMISFNQGFTGVSVAVDSNPANFTYYQNGTLQAWIDPVYVGGQTAGQAGSIYAGAGGQFIVQGPGVTALAPDAPTVEAGGEPTTVINSGAEIPSTAPGSYADPLPIDTTTQAPTSETAPGDVAAAGADATGDISDGSGGLTAAGTEAATNTAASGGGSILASAGDVVGGIAGGAALVGAAVSGANDLTTLLNPNSPPANNALAGTNLTLTTVGTSALVLGNPVGATVLALGAAVSAQGQATLAILNSPVLDTASKIAALDMASGGTTDPNIAAFAGAAAAADGAQLTPDPATPISSVTYTGVDSSFTNGDTYNVNVSIANGVATSQWTDLITGAVMTTTEPTTNIYPAYNETIQVVFNNGDSSTNTAPSTTFNVMSSDLGGGVVPEAFPNTAATASTQNPASSTVVGNADNGNTGAADDSNTGTGTTNTLSNQSAADNTASGDAPASDPNSDGDGSSDSAVIDSGNTGSGSTTTTDSTPLQIDTITPVSTPVSPVSNGGGQTLTNLTNLNALSSAVGAQNYQNDLASGADADQTLGDLEMQNGANESGMGTNATGNQGTPAALPQTLNPFPNGIPAPSLPAGVSLTPQGTATTTASGAQDNNVIASGDTGYSVAAPASCTFNGKTVASGATVTGYAAASVPYGSKCTAQTFTCSNGALSNPSAVPSCSVAAPASCTFNGKTVASGATVTGYAAASVPYGSKCTAQTFTCSNGALSNPSAVPSCSVAAPASCAFNGKTVASGATVTGYAAASVPYGSKCTAQTFTCSNGALSNPSAVPSCSVAAKTSVVPVLNTLPQYVPGAP